MKIVVVGSGYVGLVTSVCLADTGHTVVGVDNDLVKINELSGGKVPIYEPGLSELLHANLKAKRLSFTADLRQAATGAEIAFLAVGTPPQSDGSADLSSLESVASELASAIRSDLVVVIKSTVPVTTGEYLEALMRKKTPHSIWVVSNPEFLKEGTAVDDFQRPDRVVIGADDPSAGERVRRLYLPFVRNQKPILMMSRRAAELTKYAANAYLAMRVSYINEISNICERMGIDVNEVRSGMGTDIRIGTHFLYPGCGYGGSCFPKDVTALAFFAKHNGYRAELVEAIHAVNERQKRMMFEKIAARFGRTLPKRHVALWGVAFKAKTDDIRESPALTLIDALLDEGTKISVHDPQALPRLEAEYGARLSYGDDAYQVTQDTDALVVMTEWNEFRNPDLKRLSELMRSRIVFDGRNLYDLHVMRSFGFEYHPIGRPALLSPENAG